jgi:sugar/nucleoside kinase (ribokinase family)
MSAKTLLQLSGVVVDLIYRVADVQLAGGEADCSSCQISAGGGFNAMISAQQAGLTVSYGGAIGTGIFADITRKSLQDANITCLQDPISKLDQGTCVVLVDDKGERTFIGKCGADGYVKAVQLQPIKADTYDWVLLSGYGLSYEDSQQALAHWVSKLPANVSFIFDPTPVVDRIPADLLAMVMERADWISANAQEAETLTGLSAPTHAALNLAQQSKVGALVRNGADGCVVAFKDGSVECIAGFDVATVDTNGAGDAHLGSFIAALCDEKHPFEAARFANAAAALSTTVNGPATAPSRDETMTFLALQ